MVGHWLSRPCVGREFMSVYECLRDVLTTVHENCSMGCDEGLAGARGRVRGQTKDVQGLNVR